MRGRPSHRLVMHVPHVGPQLVSEVFPTGRARGFRGYCKYCYRTHRQWWLMPEDEYPHNKRLAIEDQRGMLCGYCEHVSLAGLAAA